MAMKAEHRKESPTHAVTEHARRLLNDLKTRPSNSTLVFWIVLLAVVAIGLGWYGYSKWEYKTNSAEWAKFGTATTVADLEGVEKDYPGTRAALAARFDQARALLRQGLEKYAASDEKERTEAQDKIKQAGELYAKLADEVTQYRSLSGKDSPGPVLRQEALRGAAKAYESLNLLDNAREYYQKLADSKPETQVTKDAADHVKTLDDPEKRKQLEAFYQQFLTAKASPGTP